MEYNFLGNTGLEVSKICFGGLTVGPLQANLSPAEGGKVMREAFERGINFIDTAQLYKTYPHIKVALDGLNRRDIIISSKSYAYSEETAEASLKEALEALDTDYIDIFMLHEQESEHTIRGHYEALEYFLKMKEKGYIRAVGLSTHHVAAVRAALKYDEIEVIHPIINMNGLGIQDGTVEDMVAALSAFKAKGGGVFGMKPLGGGNLLNNIDACFDFVMNLDVLDAFAVGMQSVEEVIANVNRVNGTITDPAILERLKDRRRRLHIDDWCVGCGKCMERCKNNALEIQDRRAVVIDGKCVLCGYCSAVCPEFCIKVV